eukprot:6197709-Ditylum_brightwellii.AAC.1
MADKSSYTASDDHLNVYRDEAAIDSTEKLSGVGLITRLGQVLRGGYIINESTAYCWMCALGYKYCEQHKCYYADAHERKDVV